MVDRNLVWMISHASSINHSDNSFPASFRFTVEFKKGVGIDG